MCDVENAFSWSVAEVQRNLRTLEWADERLLREFEKHEIDGEALLELTKNDLREDFGIKELGRIKRVLRSLDKFREGVKRPQPPSPTPATSLSYSSEEENDCRVRAAPTPDLQTFDLPISDEDLLSSVRGRSSEEPPSPHVPRRPPPPSPTPLAAAPPPCTPPPYDDSDFVLDMDIIELEDLVPESRSPRAEGETIPPRPVTAIGHRPPNGLDEVDGGHKHVWADDPAVHISKPSDLLHDDPDEEQLTPEAIKQLSDRPWSGVRPSPIPRPPAAEGPPGRKLPSGQRTPEWVHKPWEPPQAGSESQPLGLLKQRNKTGFDIDLSAPAYQNGILEQERRYSDLQDLFVTWVTCVGDDEAQRFIAFSGLCSVLKEFCGWTQDEADLNAGLIMNEIDSNSDGQLDWHEFFVFMTRITRSMPPTAFDNLLGFFKTCVKGVSAKREESRREEVIRKIFRKIADDGAWYISEKTLRDVVAQLREDDDDCSDVSDLINQADSGVCDGVLDEDECLYLITTLCGVGCSNAEFDHMMFRLDRAITMRDKEAPGHITRAPRLTADDFDAIISLSPSSSPLILHGSGADPTKNITECAVSCEVPLRHLLVTSDSTAQGAVRTLVRSGFNKGEWLLISIDPNYIGIDKLLREIGVKLQTESPWTIHRKFRLWLYTPQHCAIPSILSIRSVLIDIANLDVAALISTLARKRDNGYSLNHR